MVAFRTLPARLDRRPRRLRATRSRRAAQTYPTGNVNVIVAFAAGGIADGIGRLIGQKLGERLKQ